MLIGWKECLSEIAGLHCRKHRRRGFADRQNIQFLEERCLLAADLDDQPDEATIVATPTTLDGVIDSKTDVDAYRVDLEAGVQLFVTISSTGNTGFVPQIRLFGPSPFGSQSLTELPQSSTGSLEVTASKAGSYYITVANNLLTFNFITGFDGTPPPSATTGSYSLSISTSNDPPSLIPPDAYEPNNSSDISVATSVGGSQGDDVSISDLSIHLPGDNDFFQFVPNGNGTLNVSTNILQGSGNIDLLVYDQFRNLIGSSRAAGGEEFVSVIVQKQKLYVIQVQPVGQTTIEQYSLTIDGPTPQPDRFESNESAAQAVDLGLLTTNGLLIDGLTLHSKSDQDYFKFVPQRGGRLTLLKGGVHANEYGIGLYDEDLNLLNNIVVSDTVPFFTEVSAGRNYYVGIGPLGAVLESYQFSLLLTDGPNVSISNVSILEGNVGTKNAAFTVSLSAAPQNSLAIPISIAYRTEGESATSGSDFTAVSGQANLP